MSETKNSRATGSEDPVAKKGFPAHEPRSGHVKRHDRLLTGAERRERESRRAAARKAEVEAEEKARDERELEGWPAKRRER